ncbi:hypothetical protein ACHMZP_21740 [Rhodococcus baikonurensis]|uniref:hypothetical protein n=1 Tax=Rhodococcus baikonurensis TaxID=172041 RepID=UPI0037BB07AE
MQQAFATYTDIEKAWRPLSTTEQDWAGQLLDAAARWIYRNTTITDPQDDDGKLVSIAVVKGALIAGEHAGHLSYSKTLGPRTRSGTLTNPDAALVWADWMKEQLGIPIHPEPSYYFGDGDFRERW